jgi:hypothetical protein
MSTRCNAAAQEVWETIAGAALGKSVGTSAYALPGAPDLRGVFGETKVITQTRQQRGIGQRSGPGAGVNRRSRSRKGLYR